MFYEVGSWESDNGQLNFILDTFDNTCELMPVRTLELSGIHTEVLRQEHDNIAKLLMSFGVRGNMDSIRIDIAEYTLDLTSRFMINKCQMTIKLELYVVGRGSVSDICMVDRLNEHYGYSKNHVLFMRIRKCKLDFADAVRDYCYDSTLYKKYRTKSFIFDGNRLTNGMMVPYHMFAYTMNLAKSHDIEGILRAYNNFLSSRLILMCKDRFGNRENFYCTSNIVGVDWKI